MTALATYATDITLTSEQSCAVDSVAAWLRDRSKPYYILQGPAGSGKTFLARYFAQLQTGTVLYAAYTGKASTVLTAKGCPASTLHSLLYTTSKERDEELTSLHAELATLKDESSVAARRLTKRIVDLQSPKFVLKANSPLRNAKLLICDELSMVDAALAADILSFNVPLLVLGDPYQLPPIDGKGFFNDNPDFLLTEIHRQAAESPVIHLATRAREGLPLRRGSYGTSSVISRSEVTKDIALGVSQIICGSNKARVQLNLENRQLRGFSGIFPQAGERLICLRNNPREGLMNGQILETIADAEDYSDTLIRLRFAEIGQPVKCHKLSFTNAEKMSAMPYQKRAQANEFTWGSAITCHKSQGSQWNSVLVYADMWKWDPKMYAQFLYTACTRAEDRVVVAL